MAFQTDDKFKQLACFVIILKWNAMYCQMLNQIYLCMCFDTMAHKQCWIEDKICDDVAYIVPFFVYSLVTSTNNYDAGDCGSRKRDKEKDGAHKRQSLFLWWHKNVGSRFFSGLKFLSNDFVLREILIVQSKKCIFICIRSFNLGAYPERLQHM